MRACLVAEGHAAHEDAALDAAPGRLAHHARQPLRQRRVLLRCRLKTPHAPGLSRDACLNACHMCTSAVNAAMQLRVGDLADALYAG